MKCAIYARVSTKEQSTELQIKALREFAENRGFEVFREYVDEGWSGAKESRPQLNELMRDARRKCFDAVLVWKFDRFARSVKHLVMSLEEFSHLGIAFLSYSESLDTSTPMGRAMFSVIGAMAQLERDLITERVKAGVQRYISKHGHWVGRKRLEFDVPQGMSIRVAAKHLGVSRETVRRRLLTN